MPDALQQASGDHGSSTVVDGGLRVRDMRAWYGQTQVLFDMDVEVHARELVGILGHNGSGKSTMLRVLSGLHRRADYEARLDGDDLAGLAPNVIARKGLVLVRGADVFDGVTVEEHLELGARLGRITGRDGWDIDRVYAEMPILFERRKRLGPELSGGQRQLLALAVAFVSNPRCMLLDEPTTGLDMQARSAVADVLQRFCEHGVPMLVVEQNPSWLAEVCSRAYLLELGRVVAEGEPLVVLGEQTAAEQEAQTMDAP